MNRMDYFRFHEYPKYKQHKYFSLIFGALVYLLGIEVLKVSFLMSLPLFYLGYIALLTFNLLRTKVCRYRGYFLFPKKIIKFFRDLEVEVNLDDFDSIATMNDR